MRTIILSLMLMLTVGCSVQTELLKSGTETRTTKDVKFEKAYVEILRNGEPAIVEDALFIILHNDIHSYIEISQKIQDEVHLLAINGKTADIRTKALIISDYFKTDDRFKKVKVKSEYHDKNRLFTLVEEMSQENDPYLTQK